MSANFEKVIQSIQQLSAAEQEKVLRWLKDTRKPKIAASDWSEQAEKFHLALRWLEEHRQAYLGQWVCLDGETLVSNGEDARQVYKEAKAKGVAVPFIQQVREEDDTPFWGGWNS
jgi:hypothetical protein